MNGISLKELRWFSAINDEFCTSDAVTIWQAVLYFLPYANEDVSDLYFENMHKIETEVYEDFIKTLDKEGEPQLRNDNLPNYTRCYTDCDTMGNLLLSEKQINEILPKLHFNRMLVVEKIREAHIIYQELILEITKSRENRPTNIHLVEDKLRDDFERVLITRTSLDIVFSDVPKGLKKKPVICEVDKPVIWEDVIISIEIREIKSATPGYTVGESDFYIVFKAKQKILCQGTLKSLKFQGKNKPNPNQLFHLLANSRESESQQKHPYTTAIYPVAISKLRNLLKELTGIPNDPFKGREENRPYSARFRLKLPMN
jgi:hypothetical protein